MVDCERVRWSPASGVTASGWEGHHDVPVMCARCCSMVHCCLACSAVIAALDFYTTDDKRILVHEPHQCVLK